MAVENKLRLNVIAASVLMGLSLSAVASAMPSHSGEVVTPAPVKSLAEAVKDINPSKVTFTQGAPLANLSLARQSPCRSGRLAFRRDAAPA